MITYSGFIIDINDEQTRGDSARRGYAKQYRTHQFIISDSNHTHFCITAENSRADWVENMKEGDWLEIMCDTRVIKAKSGIWFHKNELYQIIKHIKNERTTN